MKRIVAIALVLVLIVALVGCGGKKRQPIVLTLSTEDSEAILRAAGIVLPDAETAPGANSIVKWICWFDYFHNYSEGEVVNTGYWTFTQKYKSDIEWIETTYYSYADTLANLLLSGDAPDFAQAATSSKGVFPMPCINGMYQPVDPWIDYTDPLWEGMADAADYFALGDYHFAIVTDVTFKDVVPYNRRVMSEWGFDDPAELYANDEWTWSVFAEMCREFSDGDADRYALDGWYIVNGICEQSTGHYGIEMDENGKYYSNIDDPIIEVGQNLIYSLMKDDCFYHVGNSYWQNRYEDLYGAGVKEGLCLFWFCDYEGWKLPVEEMNNIWGDVTEGEFMLAPLPRYDDGDGIYYLNSVPTGYVICNGARNPEGAALLAMCDRFKIIDPTVISVDKKQLKETYLWSEEMLDMYDTCYNLAHENIRMFYTGKLPDNLEEAYNQCCDWGIRRRGASTSWAQLKEQYGDQIAYYCDELNAMIDAYEYTGQYLGTK